MLLYVASGSIAITICCSDLSVTMFWSLRPRPFRCGRDPPPIGTTTLAERWSVHGSGDAPNPEL
jgi:hypothetical protein